MGVQAADLAGGVGFGGGDVNAFEGLQVIDYDDIVDRNEELRLLSVFHEITVWQNATASADGNVAFAVEVSSAPTRNIAGSAPGTGPVDGNVVGGSSSDDTIDIIGRNLFAVAHGPYSDTVNGLGGGGAEGHDQYEATLFPLEFGRFHPRDELFLNGQLTAWNIDDAGVHAKFEGQHVYGVTTV